LEAEYDPKAVASDNKGKMKSPAPIFTGFNLPDEILSLKYSKSFSENWFNSLINYVLSPLFI
jgi:hypothetical protein